MFTLLDKVHGETKPVWGKMNAQQMVEHLADFFDVSSGKIQFDLVTPEEHLPKYLEFLYSDKQFRENTKAPSSILGEEPQPARYADYSSARQHLKTSVEDFFKYFGANPGVKTIHPVFGSLTFQEWILLHYKHVRHHLRQFGVL